MLEKKFFLKSRGLVKLYGLRRLAINARQKMSYVGSMRTFLID